MLIPLVSLSQWDTSHVTLNNVTYKIATNKTDKGSLVLKKTSSHTVLSLENITISGGVKNITYVFTFMGGQTSEKTVSKVSTDKKSLILEPTFEVKKYRAYFRDCEKLEIKIQGGESYVFDMKNAYESYNFVTK